MVPPYAVGLADLKPGDFVRVECACGHDGLIHPVALASLGLQAYDRIVDGFAAAMPGMRRAREGGGLGDLGMMRRPA